MSLLDSNCCSETVFYVAVEEDCTCGIIIEVFDDSDKISVDGILYHGCPKAACWVLSKAFVKSMKTWWRFCWCWSYFLQSILKLTICSVVFLPALKPDCSSAMMFSACGFNLFSMIFSMSLPGWLVRIIVQPQPSFSEVGKAIALHASPTARKLVYLLPSRLARLLHTPLPKSPAKNQVTSDNIRASDFYV